MLEDDFNDILRKAAHGLNLDAPALAGRTGLSLTRVEATLKGNADDPAVIVTLSNALGLDANAVLRVSRNDYRPVAALPHGMLQITTDYAFMKVHAYVVFDTATREAFIIDSGADAAPLIEQLEAHSLNPSRFLLTHNHPDHIAGIAGLLERYPEMTVHSPKGENYTEGESFPAGADFTLGSIRITALATRGHTPAGVAFIISGLEKQVAVCGDSLFAGSIGGPRISYEQALSDVRSKLLSLAPDTVIAPGHGPLTTVDQERHNNPFFIGDNL